MKIWVAGVRLAVNLPVVIGAIWPHGQPVHEEHYYDPARVDVIEGISPSRRACLPCR
jgi:hypothetical protein